LDVAAARFPDGKDVKKAAKRTSPRTKKSAPAKAPVKEKKFKDPKRAFRNLIDSDEDGALEIATLASDSLDSLVTDWVSTQCLSLNRLIGRPGIPCGRITELFGEEHSGKSTVLAHIFAEVLQRGGVAALLDQEMAVDRDYYRRIGVRAEDLYVFKAQVPTIEAGVESIEKVLNFWDKYPDVLLCIGWDTISAAPAKAELEGEFSKQQPGLAARAYRAMCRRLIYRLSRRKVAFVIVSQTYNKIGVPFGDPVIAYGGKALPFYASLRLKFSRGETLKDDGVPVGSITHATIKKNKFANNTGARLDFAIAHGNGIDNVYTLFEELSQQKFIKKSSKGWSTLTLPQGDEVRWQGGWEGLVRLVTSPEQRALSPEQQLYAQMVSAYYALNPPTPMPSKQEQTR
jgi:recombination protein RecA